MPIPSVVKGALIAVDSDGKSVNKAFTFQYNPNKLIRSFSYLDQNGLPITDSRTPSSSTLSEVIYLTLELDAVDQSDEAAKTEVLKFGLFPSLAVLESIIQPKMRDDIKKPSQTLLFSWGPNRTVPVSVITMKVTEEAFDRNLNPTRATIELCLKATTALAPKSTLKKNDAESHQKLSQNAAQAQKKTTQTNKTRVKKIKA